jgi:hypothetical protein
MPSVPLADLRGIYRGQDAYILGSGRSLDFYQPSFLAGRLTIAVNDGALNAVPDARFIVTKYHEHAFTYRDKYPDAGIVVSRMQHGHEELIEDERDLIVVDTNVNTMHAWEAKDFPTDPDLLVASWSSITTAMHFAAVLGARALFLVGADCGAIDGRERCDGYEDNHDQARFWPVFEQQTREVARLLLARFGCPTVSLSPFVNPNLDGHVWVSHAGRLN